MSREVRRVPKDWQHPKDEDGHYIPLLGGSYADAAWEYEAGLAGWECGWIGYSGVWRRRSESAAAMGCKSFDAWHGRKPEPQHYMPDWPAEQRTHLMMYATTNEGTPISPALETPEQLARWLADNGANAFAGQRATYEQWLVTCRRGWAPSAVSVGGGPLVSGVAGLASR